MMDQYMKQVAAELRRGLCELYGSRLVDVRLFGSRARGDDEADSDLDVLIVLDRVDSYAAEVDRVSELGQMLSLKHGVSVSKVFVSREEWRFGKSGFLQQVRVEAVPA